MKQKTNKAASKRFSTTAKGKVKKRPVHQAHFNAKDNGRDRRKKHGSSIVNKSDMANINRLLPNR
jgi:large subunit ribosomal protein L35